MNQEKICIGAEFHRKTTDHDFPKREASFFYEFDSRCGD